MTGRFELSHNFDEHTPEELRLVLEGDKGAAVRAYDESRSASARLEAADDLYEYDLRAALRGRQIRVEHALIKESGHHLARSLGWVYDEVLTIHGVWLCTRSSFSERSYPYAHISPQSARGIWLEETPYTILEKSPVAEQSA